MKKLFLFVVVYLSALSAQAQFPITLSGYPLVTTGWTWGAGGAGIAPTAVDSEFQLTSPVTSEANYIYYSTAVNMSAFCQVNVDFDFKITSSSTGVADGFAFWFLSNPPSSAGTGSSIGLPNYANGLILIQDTYNNNGPPVNTPIETLLGYNGTIMSYVEDATTGTLAPEVGYQSFITDGSWHHVKITYNAGNINVYYNNSTTASLSGFYDLSYISAGYFGFSASTGAVYSTQQVKNVNITSTGVGTVPTVTSPVTYCVGATADTLHAVGTGGAGLHWFTTDTATVASLPGSPTPNTSVPGTYWYFVRQGSGLCISAPDSVQVIVNPVPAPPTITGTTVYCAGSTATPFTVTGTSILWYAADTGGVGSSTPSTIVTATPGTYTYYVSQTVGGCTSARDSIRVTVNAVPPAPTMTAGQLTYCQYDSFVAFAISGTNVLWYTTPGGASTSTAPVISTSTSGTYNYYVTQTVSGCESLPLHLLVTVNPKPAAPVPVSPSYCQFVASVPITSTGSNLTWYGPGVTGGYATAPTPPTTTALVDTYYVTQTALGCVSDSAMSIVTVKAKPVPPVTRDTSYCQGAVAAALTAVGSNLTWYAVATGGAPLSGAPVPPTTIPGNTLWYVTQTVNGCESDRAPLNVLTVAVPVFTITPSATFVCQYDSLTLTYTGIALVSNYAWSLPAGAVFANGSTSGMSSVIVAFTAVADHNVVTLTAGGPGGQCSATESIDIKVVPQPSAVPFTNDGPCLGDTVSLALASESANADSFTWTVDGVTMSSSAALNIVAHNSNSGGPYKISWNTITPLHVITVYAFTTEGCRSLPGYDTIHVHPYPDASFTYHAPNGLCLEDSVYFTANDSSYNDLYMWAPAHYFNNGNTHDIWGKVEESKSDVSLTVTDAYGCKSTTTQELDPSACCTVIFPMAFSPNGDGQNDFFRPIAAGYHRFHNLRIVNRWGQTVFESTNSVMEWDGTYGGIPQDIGVYYYFLKYDCGGEERVSKGDVTLVR